MKFEREQAEGKNTFTGYGEGYVEVNRQRHAASLVVAADRLLPDWPVNDVDTLGGDALAAVLALQPEIVLLGTGRTFKFPEPALLAPLHKAGVGVEVMDTQAACRTYNILVAEARRVALALVFQ